jgi:hypothetical protein
VSSVAFGGHVVAAGWSDRFPTIVQDAVTIALFAFAATVVLQEGILATTAVGAVVVGLARPCPD